MRELWFGTKMILRNLHENQKEKLYIILRYFKNHEAAIPSQEHSLLMQSLLELFLYHTK